MSIEEKCSGTSSAKEVLEIIYSESEKHEGTEGEESYWNFLFDAIVENVDVEPTVLEVTPMTDEEVIAFSSKAVPFGKHRGKVVLDVPLSYWLWLDEQPSFSRELKRYLSSEKIQELQGDVFEDGGFAE